MSSNANRCPEDKLLKGEGTITQFNIFVGRGAAIGGSGVINGEHGDVRVNYANLFFGHIRPRQVDGQDTYEGVRVKYLALPASENFSQPKAIKLESAENGSNHESNRVDQESGHRDSENGRRDNHGARKERPNKIGDPRFAGGRD